MWYVGPQKGSGVGRWVNLYHGVLFFSACTAHPENRGFSLNVAIISVVGEFFWGHLAKEAHLSHFTPKPFSVG